MKSLNINNMFENVSAKIIEDYNATLQNLELLLLTDKGEMFGDPAIGTNLKRMLFDQNDLILKEIVIDDIYTAVATYMPQLRVERKEIDITSPRKGEIEITLRAMNRLTYKTDLYRIVLLQTEA